MNTTPPTIAVKDIIAAKIARIATLENVIESVTLEQQQKVKAIITATASTLKAETSELEDLKAQVEALAIDHREELYGKKSKTLDMGTHVCAFRASDVIEVDDEEQLIAALQTTAEDPEATDADRLSAAACLRYEEPKLDKTFVRKHWSKHCEWFSGYFGFRKERKEKFTIKAKAMPEGQTA